MARLALIEYTGPRKDEAAPGIHLEGSGHCDFETACGHVNTTVPFRHIDGDSDDITCTSCLIAARDMLDALGMRRPKWMAEALRKAGAAS